MKKLLFVGGQPPFLNSIQKKSISKGYETIIAYDGEEGIEKARREHPDLIILDIKKYATADYALFKKFRLDEQLSNTQIVICAPKAIRDDEDGGQLAGADGYLEKPFDESQLFVKIESLLAQTSGKKKPLIKGRRKYPRIKKDIVIDFKLVNVPGEYQMGKSIDISQEGIKLEAICKNQFPIEGQFIEMMLKGGDAGKAITVLGQVIWVRQMKFSFDTKIGVKLIFISESDAEEIKELLR